MVEIAVATFEGLFVRALKVEGPIVQKLREAGFDPERMEPSYPVSVWRRSLQVAAAEYFPQLSSTDAEFELGRRMVNGYLETLVGRVIQAALPFLSADALCTRLPRFFVSGIIGEVKTPVSKKVAERHFSVTLFGDGGVPWFTAGAIDAVLRSKGVKPTVVVASVKPTDFTVDVTWT